MSKKLAVAGALLVTAAFVVPALARPSVGMATTVTNAVLLEQCSNGAQLWEVGLSVQVDNHSADTVTFERTGFYAKFANPAGPNQIQDQVSVLSDGGFVAGASIPTGTYETYDPIVRVSLPCDTQDASMFATVDLVGGEKQYLNGDPFIAAGTPVPVGAVGVIGIAAVLAIGGLLAQRLSRKPRVSVT